jgi:two-component system NtrC family sensor kinase
LLDNLSFRHKATFTLAVAILVTTTAVSGWLTVQDVQDAKEQLRDHTARLGSTLAYSIRHTLVHDDVWQTFLTIRSTGIAQSAGTDTEAIVLDATNEVYCASHPGHFPVSSRLSRDEPRFGRLEQYLQHEWPGDARFVEDLVPDTMVYLMPVLSADGDRLGSLVLSQSVPSLAVSLVHSAGHVLLPTSVLMAVILPAGWLWGRKLSEPIKHLAGVVARVGHEPAHKIDIPQVSQQDEVGLLARRFGEMIQQLRAKEDLEKQLLSSERLNAIGLVTASVAHEINNPLGGMLNTIATHLGYRPTDSAMEKTLLFLQRGLRQIQTTMAALLSEVRAEEHQLSPEDLQDVILLVANQAEDKGVSLDWASELEMPAPLPAVPVRQLLLNLLLNAIKAAPRASVIKACIRRVGNDLSMTVANSGAAISEECLDRLRGDKELNPEQSGRLGLWVVAQLVRRLRGQVAVESTADGTVFTVVLPLAGSNEASDHEPPPEDIAWGADSRKTTHDRGDARA